MVICVGESLIDVVCQDVFEDISKDVSKDRIVSETVGGGPLNAALTSARLGVSTALFTKISSDTYGSQILEKLIDNCIMFDPQLCNSKLPTLCAKASLDSQGKAVYSFDWKQTVASQITVSELSKAFSVMTDIDFILTGSLILTFPTTRDEIFPAIATIKPKPVIFYDPNVRPAVIEDMKEFKAKLLQFAQSSEIVKVSEEDLKIVFPEDSTEEALQLLKENCKLHLIVTFGERGATWYAPNFEVRVPAQIVPNLVDTIGCGDVFSGAIVAKLQMRKDSSNKTVEDITAEEAKELLEFASKVAAYNCTQKGCEPPTEI